MSDIVIAGLALRLQPLAQQLLAQARAAGLAPMIPSTGGARTAAEQLGLYAKGRHHDDSGRWVYDDPSHHAGTVTNALPADAPHCHRGAVDVLLLEGGKVLTMSATLPADEMARQLGLYCQLGAMGESLGLVWGGRWKSIHDYPHFELPEWRTLPICGAA